MIIIVVYIDKFLYVRRLDLIENGKNQDLMVM